MSSNVDKESIEVFKMEGKEGGVVLNMSNDNEKLQQVEGFGSDVENNVVSDDSLVLELSIVGRVLFIFLS